MQEHMDRRCRLGVQLFAGLLFGFGCGVVMFNPGSAREAVKGAAIYMVPNRGGTGPGGRMKKLSNHPGVFLWKDSHLDVLMNGASKVGMTSYLHPDGNVIPCTVLYVGDGDKVIMRMPGKGVGNHKGKDRLQLAHGPCREKSLTKPELYHLRKAGAPALKHVWETTVPTDYKAEVGQTINPIDFYKEGDHIQVRGTTIGKGTQGVVRRWNHRRGLMTHGSKSQRAPGSIGMRMSGHGGRVIHGRKMPSRMGMEKKIVKATVLAVDKNVNALIVKGSVPGHRNAHLKIGNTNIGEGAV